MTGSHNFEMDVVKNRVFFSLKYKYEVSPHFISTNSLHTLADSKTNNININPHKIPTGIV